MENVTKLWERLRSTKKLERDRGLLEFQRLIESIDPETFIQLIQFVTTKANTVKNSFSADEKSQNERPGLVDIGNNSLNGEPDESSNVNGASVTWEHTHAVLSAFKVLVSHPWSTEAFCEGVKESCVDSLIHAEYRVRIAAGECLGELCHKKGSCVYTSIKTMILSGIKNNLERDMYKDELIDVDSQDVVHHTGGNSSPRTSMLMLAERITNFDDGTKKIFHDTAGWKNLETFMKCLQSVIDGCGVGFNDQIDQELLDLIFTALTHTNRFVRETGYQVCGALVSCNSQAQGSAVIPDKSTNSIHIFGLQLAEHLAAGLADNWSQVRLAASQATRSFLSALDEETTSQYLTLLLPRMCLNRYYVAEGVRIYSQETWRRIAGDQGKRLVQDYIEPTVDFYVSQSEADNHAVREAACACIAELGSKIDKDCVRPYVARLLDTLKVCFEDDSWPVRDAACVASGNFIFCFPEECKPYLLQLKPMFFENLKDNIPSVRSGAAHALVSVAKTYGAEISDELIQLIEVSLKDVENQQANTDKYSGLDKGPATYSVVKQARDNDADLHTNNTMYSCGSLAPKMGRGGSKDKGGCMHSTFRRLAEPWEVAEGCVHLMAELSEITSLHPSISALLPPLASAVTHKSYTQHIVLLETLCKILPQLSRNIGKRHFKPHMELFFEPIFYSLSCDNALTASAASQCLNHLSNYLGPNILRGRVEMYDPHLLPQLEANIMVAPM